MGRVLAIDYGRARTGLALSDPLGIGGRPLPALKGAPAEVARTIVGLVADEEVARVLIGLPLRMDGSEAEAVREVREFQALLRQNGLAIPLEEVDERLTSRAAHAVLKDQGLRHKQRRDLVDSTAALLLLQDYLQRHRAR